MRVLENHEPALSNHCVLCGQGLDRNRQDIVLDVGIDFDLPGHPLDGRKLICQGCVFDIAKAAGLLTATQLDEAKTYLRNYRNSVETTNDGILDALEDAIKALKELPAPPSLEHLDTPAHVIVAEQNEAADARKITDWATVPDDEAPF